MAQITIVDPVTRIEGHMKVQVTIDTVSGKQQVTDAQCTGTQFRGFEKILLAECDHRRVADPGIVERLDQRVEAELVLAADRIAVEQLDVLVLGEDRQEIVRRRLNEVDFAIQQRIDLLCADDNAAEERTKQLADGHAIDLWHGDRFIATFKAEQQKNKV